MSSMTAEFINQSGAYNQETFDFFVRYRPAKEPQEHLHLLVGNRIGFPGIRPAHATNATQEAQPPLATLRLGNARTTAPRPPRSTHY